MSQIPPESFDPKIRYAFDVWNGEDNFSAKHSHDFFEASFILEGQVDTSSIVVGEVSTQGLSSFLIHLMSMLKNN